MKTKNCVTILEITSFGTSGSYDSIKCLVSIVRNAESISELSILVPRPLEYSPTFPRSSDNLEVDRQI